MIENIWSCSSSKGIGREDRICDNDVLKAVMIIWTLVTCWTFLKVEVD